MRRVLADRNLYQSQIARSQRARTDGLSVTGTAAQKKFDISTGSANGLSIWISTTDLISVLPMDAKSCLDSRIQVDC